MLAQALERVFADIGAADAHFALGGVEKARNQVGQRGFAATGCTHQRNHAALRHSKIDAIEAITLGIVITVHHIHKFDFAGLAAQMLRAAVGFFGLV